MNLDYLTHNYKLADIEVAILDYLDTNYQNADNLSIRDTAKACFTSPSTIVRLAKKLNFSGYNELLYQIKEAHMTGSNQRLSYVSAEQTDDFCDLLHAHHNELIVILAMGFSIPVANYLSDVFNFQTIPAITTPYNQIIEHQDQRPIVMIIVSHSGEEEMLKQSARKAHQNGTPLIAFLGNRNCELAGLADVLFSTDSFTPFSTSFARPNLFYGHTLNIFEQVVSEYLNRYPTINWDEK